MKLPSTPSSLQVVRLEVQRRAMDAGMAESDADMLVAAAHEAVTNAIEHGNRGDASLQVTVDISVDRGRIAVRVTDEGEGFPPMDGHEDRISERGRGLRLMRALVDEVRIEPGRGEITLIKVIRAS
jgi:serine/threonine-protein kinase RsbW